jgi:hypothetical protein
MPAEQRRKRSIRQTQEFTFLNHHIRNAITQMTMASYLADPNKQQRIRSEALERISGALRRVANSADLNELSLEVDLTGAELIQEGADGIFPNTSFIAFGVVPSFCSSSTSLASSSTQYQLDRSPRSKPIVSL